VAPLDAHQKFALPGEDVKDPNAFEFYALGLTEGLDSEPGLFWPLGFDSNSGNGAGQPKRVESKPDELSVHGPWGHAQPSDVQ